MKIFLVLGLLVTLAISFQIDDEIDPAVLSFLEVSQSPKDNDAFYYLLGIFSAEGSSPELVGRKIYKKIIKNSESYYYENDILFTNGLPLPNENDTCDLTIAQCIASIHKNKQNYTDNIEEHAVLISRYSRFMAYKEYKTLTQPSVYEPVPPYEFLVQANRLLLISAIIGGSIIDVDNILTNISSVRKRLIDADTIIGKMIYLKMLEENIDVLAFLQEHLKILSSLNVVNLSDEERSLYGQISREFRLVHDSFKSLANSKDILSPHVEVPLWVSRIIYKPNMTINSQLLIYKKLAERSELNVNEFTNEDYTILQSKSWLRNPIGTILVDIAMPNYGEYSKRIFSVDEQISELKVFRRENITKQSR
ncbi:hypothetical protein [Photobacterium sanguinicancri]|uniref:hypothetical protein n=1 Tax=Photobacterium sanguinicancri TaxID=875932 RepID=UPI003D0D69E9